MKAVLRQTGLTPETLRAWERRYGAVRPQRTTSGRRVYTSVEVQRLRALVELTRLGHSIGKIANLSDPALLRLLHHSPSALPAIGVAKWPEEVQRNVDAVITAIEAFDLATAQRALSRLRFVLSPREFAFRLVSELMFLVGSLIDQNRISIAQEHALSEVIQTHLRRIYEGLETQGEESGHAKAGSLLFCTREGDPHDLALFMAAIACRYRGFKTHFLGKNLPAASLLEAARKLRPRAIVLGLAELPREEEKIGALDYLREIDSQLAVRTELWLGGSATRALRPARLTQRDREIWIFEGISDLEKRLESRG